MSEHSAQYVRAPDTTPEYQTAGAWFLVLERALVLGDRRTAERARRRLLKRGVKLQIVDKSALIRAAEGTR